MRWLKFILMFGLVASAAKAGDTTGLFVQVEPPSESNPQGVWVANTDQTLNSVGEYWGLQELIEEDCSNQVRCEYPSYGKQLVPWLDLLNKYLPETVQEMRGASGLVLFKVVDNALSYVPDDLPDRVEDFRKYMKAAIYRPNDGNNGIVYISKPAMETHGQSAPGRINAKQGRGLHLLHELLNIVYHGKLVPNQISRYGTVLLDAHYSQKSGRPMSKEDFLYRLERLGVPVATDPIVSLDNKLILINHLEALGIIHEYSPFMDSFVFSSINYKDLSRAKDYVEGKISLNELIQAQGSFESAILLLEASDLLKLPKVREHLHADLDEASMDAILRTYKVIPLFQLPFVYWEIDSSDCEQYRYDLFQRCKSRPSSPNNLVVNIVLLKVYDAIKRYAQEISDSIGNRGLWNKKKLRAGLEASEAKRFFSGQPQSFYRGSFLVLPEFEGPSGDVVSVVFFLGEKQSVKSLRTNRKLNLSDYSEIQRDGSVVFKNGLYPVDWSRR